MFPVLWCVLLGFRISATLTTKFRKQLANYIKVEVVDLYHATHVEPLKKIFSIQISWRLNIIFFKELYLMSWSRTDVLAIRMGCSWKSKLTGSCFWFTSMIFWNSLQASINGLSSYLSLTCLWIPKTYKKSNNNPHIWARKRKASSGST